MLKVICFLGGRLDDFGKSWFYKKPVTLNLDIGKEMEMLLMFLEVSDGVLDTIKHQGFLSPVLA